MAVEIRHDDRVLRLERALVDQVRNDPARHKVRADRDVRIEFLDELDQRLRVQPVELLPHRLPFPRLIGRAVDPAENRRGVLHQFA
jgi:hypothetical protein